MYCLHQSCSSEVAEANNQIRTAWSLFSPPIPAEELALAKQKAARRHELEEKARASLPEILKQYKWDAHDIERNCESFGPYEQHLRFLELFKADDIIWIGEPESSGSESHKHNFRTRKEWAADFFDTNDRRGWYRFTCPSTFKPETYSRGQTNVASTPFLIVEGDSVLGVKPETEDQKLANKNACGAIARWLQEACQLNLRAIVDSGNRSLHLWLDMPESRVYEELKIILPAMGADRAMFKPTQPARLPGIIRENGNEQKLLWIK